MTRGGEPLYIALKHDVTAYLCYILFIAAVGPLQFGFHLVHFSSIQGQQALTYRRQS